MNQNYSKIVLTQSDKKEKLNLNEFFDGIEEKKPRKAIVANILNYSKALSIRKSETLNHIEMVLN